MPPRTNAVVRVDFPWLGPAGRRSAPAADATAPACITSCRGTDSMAAAFTSPSARMAAGSRPPTITGSSARVVTLQQSSFRESMRIAQSAGSSELKGASAAAITAPSSRSSVSIRMAASSARYEPLDGQNGVPIPGESRGGLSFGGRRR